MDNVTAIVESVARSLIVQRRLGSELTETDAWMPCIVEVPHEPDLISAFTRVPAAEHDRFSFGHIHDPSLDAVSDVILLTQLAEPFYIFSGATWMGSLSAFHIDAQLQEIQEVLCPVINPEMGVPLFRDVCVSLICVPAAPLGKRPIT